MKHTLPLTVERIIEAEYNPTTGEAMSWLKIPEICLYKDRVKAKVGQRVLVTIEEYKEIK